MRTDAQRYLHAVSRQLNCPQPQRKAFCRRLTADIAETFGEKQPTWAELESSFGAPQALATEYQETLDQDALCAYQQAHQRQVHLAFVALAATLLLVVGFLAYHMWESWNFAHSVITVETHGYSYGNVPEGLNDEEFREWVEQQEKEQRGEQT